MLAQGEPPVAYESLAHDPNIGLAPSAAETVTLFTELPYGHPLHSPVEGLAPLPTPSDKGALARRQAPEGVELAYRERFNHLEASPHTGRRWYGRTQRLRRALRRGRLRLYLPSEGRAVRVRITSVAGDGRESESGYLSAHGDLNAADIDRPDVPCFESYGNFGLYDTEDGMAGFINTATTSYTIAPIGPDRSVIFEAVVPQGGTDEDCNYCDAGAVDRAALTSLPVPRHDHETGTGSASEALFPDPICVVDLAVVFDAQGAREAGDVNVEAQGLVDRMNDVLERNDIDDRIQYRLAGIRVLGQIYPTTFADQVFNTIGNARTDGPSFAEHLLDARVTFSADQAMLMVGGTAIRGRFGDVAGVSQLGDRPIDRWQTVTEVGTEWRFTGVHELAHNHGCKHHNHDEVGTVAEYQSFARGSEYIRGQWSSVMGPAVARGFLPQRSPHFSDPDIAGEGGVITGTNSRDNARQMVESSCFVAGMSDSEEFDDRIWVGGPSTGCTGDIETYTFSARCNNSVVERVQWEASVNGGPFQLVNRGAATLRYRLPRTSATQVVLRATARCAGGFIRGTKEVWADRCRDPCGLSFSEAAPGAPRESAAVEPVGGDAWSLRPSLASGERVLEARVSDLVGRPLQTSVRVSGGVISVERSHLPAGAPVVISIVTNERIITKVLTR